MDTNAADAPPSRILPPHADAPNAESAIAPPGAGPEPARAAAHERRLRIGAEALPARVDWRLIALFTGIAVAAGWAVCLPFWFAGGLEALPSLFQPLLLALMFTPTLAALVVVFLVQRPARPLTMLGLRFRPAGRTLLFLAIAWLLPPLLFVAGLFLAGGLGLVSLDLTFEAFRQTFIGNAHQLGVPAEQLEVLETMPTSGLIAMVLAQTVTMGVALSSLAAFGEELGWRGWLLPNLRPLGTWPAILVSSVIWGLWHAPIILLGYNFNDRGPLGLLLMVGFCVAVGTFLSWLRLRSASVYPAAVAHGSVNAFAGTLALVFVGDMSSLDPTAVLLGWSGWLPWFALALLLVVLGQFRRQPLPGLTLAESVLALERREQAHDADATAVTQGVTAEPPMPR